MPLVSKVAKQASLCQRIKTRIDEVSLIKYLVRKRTDQLMLRNDDEEGNILCITEFERKLVYVQQLFSDRCVRIAQKLSRLKRRWCCIYVTNEYTTRILNLFEMETKMTMFGLPSKFEKQNSILPVPGHPKPATSCSATYNLTSGQQSIWRKTSSTLIGVFRSLRVKARTNTAAWKIIFRSN